MEREQLSAGQVTILLSLSEDYYVDYKAREVDPSKLSKWASAFSNSSGGDLYVGVDEGAPGLYSWRGFDRLEDMNAHAAVLQRLFPPSDNARYVALEAAGQPGIILKVELSKTADIRLASNGKAYRRSAAGVEAVESEEGLYLLRLQKGIATFETETIVAPVSMIADSYQITEFVSDVVPTTEPLPWLKKQLMIREGLPTVAGLVLFADEPQVVLPKASVIVYRYKTDANSGTREALAHEKTFIMEGSAYSQITSAVQHVVGQIEGLVDQNLEPVQYPRETLHEIITNAVIHRDYSMKDNVHVRIFDDRVEVESPGRLPGLVTPRNILEARFSRNEIIERILHKFPDAPNKNVGEGLNTAFSAMTKMRLAQPEIIERGSNVLVIIRHERLDSPATLILQYLAKNATINNREARNLTGIARDNTMLRLLQRMEEKLAIERVPGSIKGGSRYQLYGTATAARASTRDGIGEPDVTLQLLAQAQLNLEEQTLIGGPKCTVDDQEST